MRKIVLIFIGFVCSLSAFAQKDTTKIKVSPEVKEKINKAQDRVVFEFSFDNMINKPDSFDLKWFSFGFNSYFMYDLVLGKSRFSIAPGIGFGANNYYNTSSISHDSAKTYFTPIDKSVYDYKKNKFNVAYFDIPIEFRFRSKPNTHGTSWKLSAGFKAGVLIKSKWKYSGPDLGGSGEDVKQKLFKIANLEKFRYGVTLRGGYGMFNIFGYYGIGSLFKKDAGPQFHPISVGISINGL